MCSKQQERMKKSLEQQATRLLRKHGYDEWGTRIAESKRRKREVARYLRKVGGVPFSKAATQ